MTEVFKGKCGFLDCEKDNLPGLWPDTGSFMCPEHRVILREIRENLRKNNKWERSQKKALCAKTNQDEYCYDCPGAGNGCDWADASADA